MCIEYYAESLALVNRFSKLREISHAELDMILRKTRLQV